MKERLREGVDMAYIGGMGKAGANRLLNNSKNRISDQEPEFVDRDETARGIRREGCGSPTVSAQK
jgi:hypothetical protein